MLLFGLEVALVAKNPLANVGDKRCGFDPWIGKIPWMRAWKPIPVFLSEKSHGQRSLEGYSTQDRRVRHDSCEDFTHTCLVAKSCWTLWDPMDCSPACSLSMEYPRQEYCSGFSFPISRGFSQSRGQNHAFCLTGEFFNNETCGKPRYVNMHN